MRCTMIHCRLKMKKKTLKKRKPLVLGKVYDINSLETKTFCSLWKGQRARIGVRIRVKINKNVDDKHQAPCTGPDRNNNDSFNAIKTVLFYHCAAKLHKTLIKSVRAVYLFRYCKNAFITHIVVFMLRFTDKIPTLRFTTISLKMLKTRTYSAYCVCFR